MTDFSVVVGGDFSDLLQGFRKLEQDAKASGQSIGKGIAEGIQGFSTKSLAALQAELNRLQSRQTRVAVDSSAFEKTGQRIKEVQALIAQVERNRLTINTDPRSIDGLSAKLAGLQAEFNKTTIGSQRFKELQAEIRNTERELGDATQSAGGLRGVIQALGPAIAAIGVASGLAAFTKQAYDSAVAAESAQVRIKALGDQFGEADRIQKIVAESAKQLNITNTEAADGFLQLYGALRPTGISLEDIRTVFTATNAAAKNFGLSAGSVQAAVLQLSQGLAAGTLQGDELRSIMEQMPPVAQAIAKEMGITVGQVKKFGSEGKITSDIVIKAIKGMNETELGKLDTTLQSTAERLNTQRVAWNELSVTVGEVFVRASLPVIEAITKIAQSLTGVASALIDAPGPINALIAAVVGIPTAYAAARLAVIAFNTELVGGQLKAAMDGIKQLGVLLKTQFVADVATAKAAWVAFKTSVQTGEMQQQIVALIGKFGPLAVAVAGVAAAIAAYRASTADAKQIAESAAEGQVKLTKALTDAGIKTDELTTLGGPFARAWQNSTDAVEALLAPLRQIPAVGPLVVGALQGIWETLKVIIPGFKGAVDAITGLVNAYKKAVTDANTTQGLENATIALNNLQNQSTKAQNAAVALFAELKASGGPPNPAQTEQIKKLAEALLVAKDGSGQLKAELLDLAAQARNSGNEELALQYEKLANSTDSNVKFSQQLIDKLNALLPASQKVTAVTKEQEAAVKARAAAEAELNKIISEAPVRQLESQLAVGQQLLGLTKAIGDLEQSRFNVTKSALQFELQQLEQIGAGEAAIAAKKAEIDQVDRAALAARYQALVKQQQLEQAMLALSQEKARVEANLQVKQAEIDLLKARNELAKLGKDASQEERDLLQAQIALQNEILGVVQGKATLLAQIQPIEAASAAATAEIARNGLQADAAAKGYILTLDGGLVKLNELNAEAGELYAANLEATQKLAVALADAETQALSLAESQLAAVEAYSQAVQSAEQSRFDIARAFNEYELKKLEERGASEAQLSAKRREGERIDQEALIAKINGAKAVQDIERQSLAIKQQQAQIEASMTYGAAILEAKKAALQLDQALLSNDEKAIAFAQTNLEIANLGVSAASAKLGTLSKIQLLEAGTLQATQQTVLNQLAAEAAAKGYTGALNASLVQVGRINTQYGGIIDYTGRAAALQAQFAGAAQQAGISAGLAADGSIKISSALSGAKGDGSALAGSFVKVGEKAPAAAQGARDFSGWLSKGNEFATKIAELGLDLITTKAAQGGKDLANETERAARAANDFYQQLLLASGLPGARWAGGPVTAGQSYRINDGPGGRSLGQEAFLSAGGNLSLINRPANSTWTAPSSGLVVPAGITARLKDHGVLPGGTKAASKIVAGPLHAAPTADPATAALAVEVANLRSEVSALNRKNWAVNVQLRQDGSGLRMQRLLNQIR
jgi:tape measure domain-containing protein